MANGPGGPAIEPPRRGAATTTDKYLANCYHCADNVEKATVTMPIAGTAAATEGETASFLTCDSVGLAVKGGVDGLSAEGYPPLSDLVTGQRDNGGKVRVCPRRPGPDRRLRQRRREGARLRPRATRCGKRGSPCLEPERRLR